MCKQTEVGLGALQPSSWTLSNLGPRVSLAPRAPSRGPRVQTGRPLGETLRSGAGAGGTGKAWGASAGARAGQRPGGRGTLVPSFPVSSVPLENAGRGGGTRRPPRPEAQRAREVEAGGPPAPPAPLAPRPLPFQGLFLAEPGESVSPVEVISLESGRRGCKSPAPPAPVPGRPPELGRGRRTQGARVGPAATRGPRPQLGRPPRARPRGLNAVNPSIKPAPPSPQPRAPPRGLLCVSPACGSRAWEAGPGRSGVCGSAARSHEGPGGLQAAPPHPSQ